MKSYSPPNQGHASPSKAAVERLLGHMPTDIASSFTPDQLLAIRYALPMVQHQRHTVDIPIPLSSGRKLRFYMALLTRTHRQSGKGKVQTTQPPLWRSPAIVALLMTLTGIGTFMSALYVTRFDYSRLQRTQGPAAIPFISDQARCESSGRIWQDNQCLDYEHNRTF